MVNSHGRFVWYELMTTDMAAAKTFYTRVMGWRAQDASMPGAAYALFTAGKASVTGVMDLPEDAKKTGAMSRWLGYVAVEDVDAAVDRIKQLGGAVRVPPRDVPNISRFSVVADPQMAALALVKGLKPGEAQSAELNAPGRVGWHELLAANWEQAFPFYSELFGWQKSDFHAGEMGTYQQFSAAGETIGGMFTKPPTLPFPFWLYYFNVADIEAATKRVEAGGGEILYGPIEAPGGAWIVHCMDPQGAVFGLLDRRRRKAIGYFISSASRDPSDARGGRE
ncbi:MAG: VOC family protein [Methylocella sp.]